MMFVCVVSMFVQDVDVAAQLVMLGRAVYIDTAQSADHTSDLQASQVTEAKH